METIEQVKDIYRAFGAGDVQAILARMAPDVEWEYGAVDAGVPWLAPRRGPAGVVGFFQAVAEHLDITRFEVVEVVGNERLAVGVIRIEATVKRTGKRLREEAEAHLWTFGSDGKITRFRHAADTLGHHLAFQH